MYVRVCVPKLISPRIRRPVGSLSLCLVSVCNLPPGHRLACNMTNKQVVISSATYLYVPCMHALQPHTRRFPPLKLLDSVPSWHSLPTPGLEPGKTMMWKIQRCSTQTLGLEIVPIGVDEEELKIG